ncbi:hypothetical protein ABEB36_001373 [Hypothenemus hampei]|uniref:F-box domain-containing protein n=1 Tax=Hypothenemus hampei TaxID=57062 RepID=A0ABD1FEC5_HYPHA
MDGNHVDWSRMPFEILCYIFQFFSYRDKLVFLSVCTQWQKAVGAPLFWKKIIVKIDRDLNEPSLLYLIQKYYMHIEILEIGWSVPYASRLKYPEMNYKEIVKRVGRFLILFFERRIQLKHLVIANWYDIYQLRKLCYFLVRIIRHQTSLESITLHNANLNEMNFSKILVLCTLTRHTINQLNIHYSTFNAKRFFDWWVFTNCIEMFDNLTVLTIDCWIFLQFFYKLRVTLHKLELLNLYVANTRKKCDGLIIVNQTDWEKFVICMPKTVVTLKMDNPMSDKRFERILQKHYPLVAFEWNYLFYNESCLKDCQQCLERLVKEQQNVLEKIRLNIPLERNQLQDIIDWIRKKCQKLQSFVFNNQDLLINETGFPSL